MISDEEKVRDRLALAIGGFTYFELLYCAAQLDLVDYLSKNPGASAAQISRGLKIPVSSARVLLTGCCTLGFIRLEKTRYYNSHYADLFDRRSQPNLVAQLEAHHHLIFKPMHRLLESLKRGTNVGLQELPPRGKGRTIYDRIARDKKRERVFHAWMDSVGDSGLGDVIIDHLQSELGNISHLVDYGGGDGTNAIRLCRSFPNLKVSIFDLPSVCKLAKKQIHKQGLSERIQVVPGNFFRKPFLRSVDAIMFSHITNIYSDRSNLELLQKSYRSLKPGGLLILFDSICSEDGKGPPAGPFLSAYFLGLATGEGMVYDLSDYDRWLKKAGFKKWQKFSFESGHALILARKPVR